MTRRGETRGTAPSIHIKRAYEPPAGTDGYRVLVDRLWPRGVGRDQLRLNVWNKELAPSDALRRWFAHNAARWGEFVMRYEEELRAGKATALLGDLVARAKTEPVTLVYAARDEEHNNAVVLKRVMDSALNTSRS